MYNYNRHFIDEHDVKSVIKALKSDWITQGPYVNKFEDNIKSFFNSKYASVVSNGTAALHLSMLALNIKKNDFVITSPMSFLASANCICYVGATPSFVDIENVTGNIDINKLEDKIKKLKSSNKKVKAIIAVDFAGAPNEWSELNWLSKKNNIKIINDNCHSMGSIYNKDKSYAVKYADIVTQSYHAVKNITLGEGGGILTNSKLIDKKVKQLRTHGTFRSDKLKQTKGNWFYEMRDLGYNYRITDIQCALGITQLKKLNKFITKRRKLAKYYDTLFIDRDKYTVPQSLINTTHSYHLYPLRFDFKKNNIDKVNFIKKLIKKNITLQVHYIPIHLQPYYKKKFGYKKGDFPVAERFYEQEISLPLHYGLEYKDLDYIYNNIKSLTE